jgi:putative restriction endonuclease
MDDLARIALTICFICKKTENQMSQLTKPELLGKVLQGLRDGGWMPIVTKDKHPFLMRVASPDRESFDLRVYIWNCTHGGGNRAADEFRIQVTSAVPHIHPKEVTVLLGWHDDTQVFAAWDIKAHDGQDSSSPSAQIKEGTLEAAHVNAFATQVKGNEIVAAFRPMYLADYALSSASLHKTGKAHKDMSLLNDLDAVTDDEIEEVADTKRRTIIRTIVTKYRSAKFREKVLDAYGHKCAFCQIQLSLIDAAHIIPVASPESTDEVVNGVALCKLHHFAYDGNLVSFNERYQIEISKNRVRALTKIRKAGGLADFEKSLGKSILLPTNSRQQPNPAYIKKSRRIRGWNA